MLQLDQDAYIGIDWFVLEVLGSTLVCIFIEKLWSLRKSQPVLRPEWQTDFYHFVINNLIIGFSLILTNFLVLKFFNWAEPESGLRSWVQHLPFAVGLFLILLVADLVQYAVHRAYHEIPALWRVHAIHHSVKNMDWMASTRQHTIELLLTRTLKFLPILALGFSQEVVYAYLIIVGFQAVFVHANVRLRLGPLRYLIVTPHFHHWHHAHADEAHNKNYAAHFSFLDYLFGTAVKVDNEWPDEYGVLGDDVANSFVKQLGYPFKANLSHEEKSEAMS